MYCHVCKRNVHTCSWLVVASVDSVHALTTMSGLGLHNVASDGNSTSKPHNFPVMSREGVPILVHPENFQSKIDFKKII